MSWTIIEVYPTHHIKKGRRHCKAKCACGLVAVRDYGTIKRGTSKGCNACSKAKRWAGHINYSKTRIHRIWLNMRNRCNNTGTPDYQFYGARGIKVCEEWSNFKTFAKWALDNGYKDEDVEFAKQLSIDRIDPAGDYEPSNCQWLTVSANAKKQFTDKE